MEKVLDLLTKIAISLPFGLGAILLFIKSLKFSNQFFFQDYTENKKERFRKNLLSNLYMAFSVACIMVAIFVFQFDILNILSILIIIPVALCMGALIIPIGIIGSYWRSYQANKMWGGFLPTVRSFYGYSQNVSAKQNSIDPSKIKIPRRIIIVAGAIALFVFFGMLYIFSKVEWNGPDWTGTLALFLFSGIISFGIFMTIVSSSLSRRIEKLRKGEPTDDD